MKRRYPRHHLPIIQLLEEKEKVMILLQEEKITEDQIELR
jgi:hypothetical protein